MAASVMAASLAACGAKPPPQMPTPEVGVETLVAQSVTLSVDLAGRTTGFMTSDVRPQVSGLIKARLFQEGAVVRAGQPLYQIDPSLYKATVASDAAALENAKAALATADAKVARYKSLTNIDAVSRQDIDDAVATAREAQATVKQDEAQLQTARINLGYTVVTAPISGRIGRSSYTPGALVTASQTDALATIQQLDPIYVDITQSSARILALRQALAKGATLAAAATANLTLEDGTAYPLAGHIEFAEAAVDENTGTVMLRARFPNPNSILLPGMFVRATIAEGVAPHAILAPQEGVSRDVKGDATALLVGADGKVTSRTVQTDRAIGNKWLITSGLNVGDRLIVQGTAKVKPGMAVHAVAVSLDKAS